VRCLGWTSRVHGAAAPPDKGARRSRASGPDTPEVTAFAADPSRVVEVRAARGASERLLPRMSWERMTHEPVREEERQLSPAPTPARMMNILEAEGGTKIAVRFAPPHPGAGGHRLG
jgi:hypothetical protein